MIEIKLAKTGLEEAAIFKFRYEVYIKELGKFFLKKTKNQKSLSDELDDRAYNFYYENSGKIKACLRCVIQKPNSRLKNKFGLDLIDDNFLVAQLDRFMVDKDYRGKRIALYFFEWVYKFGLRNNVQLALIEAEECLVKLYIALGFKVYRTIYLDNEGKLKRYQLYLNLQDYENLRMSRSLLFKNLIKHTKHIDNMFTSGNQRVKSA